MALKERNPPSETVLHGVTERASGAGFVIGAAELEELLLPSTSRNWDAWNRFRHNWLAVVSLAAILLCCIGAIFAPFLHTMDPLTFDYGHIDVPPGPHFWFGTDGLGRDQYSRLLYGLRPPLIIAVLGTVVTIILGAVLGVAAATSGGWIDSLISRVTDLLFAFPAFLMALLAGSLFHGTLDPYFGGSGQVILFTIIFAVVGWPSIMRFVKALVLSLGEEQFVEAARVSGGTSWSIMRRHLMPNMFGLILVQAGFLAGGFVYLDAGLSLFGLGVLPPNPDLGVLLIYGDSLIGYNDAEVVFPAIVLTVLIVGFTFLGDGIRDAVDPRG